MIFPQLTTLTQEYISRQTTLKISPKIDAGIFHRQTTLWISPKVSPASQPASRFHRLAPHFGADGTPPVTLSAGIIGMRNRPLLHIVSA